MRRPHPRPALLACALSVLLGVAALPAAHAADLGPKVPDKAADRLAEARAAIDAQRWPDAIARLKAVNAADSADWHNLMGFALRKGTPPDLDGAEAHYDQALKIDPRHKGALEYSGELYLMRGDLPRAERQLAALDKICFLPCEEYTDLKAAIARFKATGR